MKFFVSSYGLQDKEQVPPIVQMWSSPVEPFINQNGIKKQLPLIYVDKCEHSQSPKNNLFQAFLIPYDTCCE